jgi:uncharacterized protein
MLITKDTNDALFQIRAYRPGFITVNDQVYQHSLIITAQKLIDDWSPQSLLTFTPENWSPVLELNPEIILLGTGRRFKMPHPSLLAPVYARKIGVESMDTGAACRTFMALVAEGRIVAAALLVD